MARRNVIKSIFIIPIIFDLFALFILFVLFFFAFQNSGFILSKTYYLRVFYFTFFQAFIATCLSIFFALIIVITLRKLSTNLFTIFFKRLLFMPFFIPSLIGCLALVNVFGQNGIIYKIFSFFKLPYLTFMYGIIGIILTHLFYYIPFILRQFSQALQRCSNEYERLASSLFSTTFLRFRFLYFPFLKKEIFPAFILTMLYCFRSFTTILIFGGKPANTTLEVALFHALNFDFDWKIASQICLLQLTLNFLLFFLANSFQKKPFAFPSTGICYKPSFNLSWLDKIIIFLCLIFFILPLFSLFYQGMISPIFFSTLLNFEFWQALFNSLIIGGITTILGIGAVSFFIYCKYLCKNQIKFTLLTADIPVNLSMIFSPLVFATVFIILFSKNFDNYYILLILLASINAIAFLPSLYRVLCNEYLTQRKHFDHLCFTLNLSNWNRFKLLDWHKMKSAFGYALSICLIFSLGDAKGILFFNQLHFQTIISLVYQKMYRYQFKEAASISAWGLIISFILFIFFQKIFGKHQKK